MNHANILPPIAITAGDPAGVGPEISIKVASEVCTDEPVLVVGSLKQLQSLEKEHGLASLCIPIEKGSLEAIPKGRIGVLDMGDVLPATIASRAPTTEGGAFQLRILDAAVDLALAGSVRALVTAPMSKEAVSLSGVPFRGHTEHMALRAGLLDDDVTMLFLGPKLRVGLVTTHLPLKDVPKAVTKSRVCRTLSHLEEALRALYGGCAGTRASIIGVAGLNPHAGEHGLLGVEDADVLGPSIRSYEGASAGVQSGLVQVKGPMGAETAFRLAAAQVLDGVVAMYHDQATIACKLMDWERSVNVTWGLPFVRTSVDHGVAYDAAGGGMFKPPA